MVKDRLKKLRLEHNLLQKDIATMLNITTSAYGYYEQGNRIPDVNTINLLAKYFNVSVDYLLGNTEIKETAEEILNRVTNSEFIYFNLNDGFDTNSSSEARKEIELFLGYIKYKYKK